MPDSSQEWWKVGPISDQKMKESYEGRSIMAKMKKRYRMIRKVGVRCFLQICAIAYAVWYHVFLHFLNFAHIWHLDRHPVDKVILPLTLASI